MRRIAALTTATLALLLTSSGPADAQERRVGPRPVSGMVEEVDRGSRTLVLGGETYFVPAEVSDLSSVEVGEWLILHWRQRGNRMVATEIEDREAGG